MLFSPFPLSTLTIEILLSRRELLMLEKNQATSYQGKARMDENAEKKNMVMPHINLVEVKKATLVSSAPSTPIGHRKSSSMKYSCLCSPTTHAGSFRCRYHRNSGLTPNNSIGSKLSELAAGPKLPEFTSKPSRMYDLHAE